MRRLAAILAATAAAFAAVAAVPAGERPASAWAYPDHPLAGITGGFGEPTCHSCHFDGPENDPGGSLELLGLPDRLQPGRRYELRIHLRRPGLAAAGFQLSARTPDGLNAGTWHWPDSTIQHLQQNGISYLTHRKAGTDPTGTDRSEWVVHWTAPDSATTVLFHLAANAANGDASEFGDHTYRIGRQASP